jgi:uncharacterized protein YbaR (Trm112 family)
MPEIALNMDKRLLDIICCPMTKVPLQLLDGERLSLLNTAISAGKIKNHSAETIGESLSEALVTRNGHTVYPVRDGIPILLEEESIDWNQVAE